MVAAAWADQPTAVMFYVVGRRWPFQFLWELLASLNLPITCIVHHTVYNSASYLEWSTLRRFDFFIIHVCVERLPSALYQPCMCRTLLFWTSAYRHQWMYGIERIVFRATRVFTSHHLFLLRETMRIQRVIKDMSDTQPFRRIRDLKRMKLYFCQQQWRRRWQVCLFGGDKFAPL